MLPTHPEIREWLQKARNDLLSARILLEHVPPIIDVSCFHSQQSVEKALKGFLVYRGVRFERTHNLVYLLDLCEDFESNFAHVRERAELLVPFAVEVRYPGSPLEVTVEEGNEALATAEAVWHLVLGLVPPEMHPT